MNGFDRVREAVAARLKAAMPKEVYVVTSPGAVDETEIAGVCVKSPALLARTLAGLSVDRKCGESCPNLRFGVYLVTAPGRMGCRPDDVALAILPFILSAVEGEDWDLPEVLTRPDKLRADNLYSGKLGNIGLLALWGVSWEQYVKLPEEDGTDDLADFLRCELDMTEADSGLRTDDIFIVRTGEPVPPDSAESEKEKT